jgi:DNA-binding winged helix-turn-helix (wHTH) protein/tetratricopeptide (TPR) repeat protein
MASSAGQKTVFRFGLFEADPESGELLKQGEHLRLQDQPFRMLILLLERPGEVISREELREKLWPENTFVEFDNGLNVAAKKIRDALSDSAENPRFLETVPRRGYRFIAPVSINVKEGARLSPEPSPPRDSKSEHQVPGPARRSWRYISWGAGIIVIAVASVLLFNRFNLHKANNNPPPVPTGVRTSVTPRRIVAVLEFQNVSRHPTDDWLSTAIAEMMTTELGAGEKLNLVPAEDVSRMKRELHLANSSNLARETAVIAAKNLKADMLVLGSFTAMGTGGNRRVRIDVRMQDSSNGEIVAEVAETAPEEQLFELVARAGLRLREALGLPGASLPDQAAARALLPANAVASRLYAEGLARLRVLDAAGARDLFSQAIAAEPKFPLAHMALASAWRTLGYDQKARSEGRKALDLSARLPRADRLLIEGRYHEMMGEMDQAIAAYRALFALFPDSLEDGLLLAEAQTWGGKPADALATVDVLRKLPEPLAQDPRIDMSHAGAMKRVDVDGRLLLIRRAQEKGRAQGAPLLVAKAQLMECSLLYFTGHYDDATRPCEEAQRVFTAAGNASDAAQAVRLLGDTRMRRGRLEEALDLFQQALKMNQAAGDDRGMAVSFNEMAIVYEGEGDLKHAEDVYRRAYLLFLKLGHTRNASILAANVGGTLLEQGRLAEAETMFGRAMELARQGGSREAEAAAHRTLAELARLRGRLEDALEHTKSAESNDESDPVGEIDDLSRVSKILAVKGDLAGARAKQQQALSLAEKTGAKSAAAQSRVDLALLDLEEGRPAQAEQPIRDALAVFVAEKMRDDELNGHILLSRCLIDQGKLEQANAALNEIRKDVSHNQNPVNRLLFSIADARMQAAGATPSRSSARTQLQRSIREAGDLGLLPLQLEAQLALDEMELSVSPAAGKNDLESLESRAHAHGFELIAQRAAALRIGRNGLPTSRSR